MKKRLKRVAKWGGLTLLVVYILSAFSVPSPATPARVATVLTQDPTLVADAQELGINYSNLNMSFASSLNADDVNADQSNTTGLFQAPNNIQIKSGQSHADELTTLAYEYLHYVWQNLPDNQKQQLTSTYQKYYDSDYNFRQLNANYVGTTDVLADERNSVACTIVQPYSLTDEFNKYCDQFIPNRSILF